MQQIDRYPTLYNIITQCDKLVIHISREMSIKYLDSLSLTNHFDVLIFDSYRYVFLCYLHFTTFKLIYFYLVILLINIIIKDKLLSLAESIFWVSI